MKRHLRFISGFFNFIVRYYVISLVRVFAYGCFYEIKIGQLFFYLLAQFPFAEIRVAQSHVVRLIFHGVMIFYSMDERSRDVADMNIISFEVSFKKHEKAVIDGAVHEIIDQKVEPHPRAYSECRSEAESCSASAFKNCFFRVNFKPSIKRYRPQGTLFGAIYVLFSDSISAVRGGIEYHLILAYRRGDELYGIKDDGFRFLGFLRAQRRPGEAGERYDDVRIFQFSFHNGFITRVRPDDIQFFIVTGIKKRSLAVHKAINDRYAVVFLEKRGN